MEQDKKLIATALSYDKSKDLAPKILAMGEGHIAAQIIAIAAENNIDIKKDADLAHMLSVLDVGAMIPIEAYAIVAEIIAHIYRNNN